MRRSRMRSAAALVAVFALGVGAGVIAAKAPKGSPELFKGKDPKQAAAALLDVARGQAGDGSWENLAVARAQYLGGDKAGGQQVFDRFMGGKEQEDSDYMRIGRVYLEANEWDKAEAAFTKAIALRPKDGDNLSEIGAYYYARGNRPKAEELWTTAVTENPDDVYVSANIAGALLGVKPLY